VPTRHINGGDAIQGNAGGGELLERLDLAGTERPARYPTPGGKGGLFCHTPLVAVARNIGRKRAMQMALTGDQIDAATAASWGLINYAVPDDELDGAVHDLLSRATRGSIASKAAGKRGFYAQTELGQTDAYTYAIDAMAEAAISPGAQEGIAAFLGKRKAKYADRP